MYAEGGFETQWSPSSSSGRYHLSLGKNSECKLGGKLFFPKSVAVSNSRKSQAYYLQANARVLNPIWVCLPYRDTVQMIHSPASTHHCHVHLQNFSQAKYHY